MPNPFLIGQRVQLRPYEEEDAPTLAAWINDPEIRRFLSARFPMSLKDEREWVAALTTRKGLPQDIALGIELKRGSRLVGSVGLHGINWVNRRAMSGSFIGPASLRGKGYGTEAKNLLLDYAFGELGMMSVWSFVHQDNAASIRALEKQGYRQSGRFRRAELINGEWFDNLYFDILRSDWEALRRERRKRARRRK